MEKVQSQKDVDHSAHEINDVTEDDKIVEKDSVRVLEEPLIDDSNRTTHETTKNVGSDNTVEDLTATETKDNAKSNTEQADEAQQAPKDESKVVKEIAKDNNIEDANGAQKTGNNSANKAEDIPKASVAGNTEEHISKDTNTAAGTPELSKDLNESNGTKTPEKAVSDRSEPSKGIQEGQRWNNRDRERVDYKKNIKSDLTSQEESSDPVAIRKQVGWFKSLLALVLSQIG